MIKKFLSAVITTCTLTSLCCAPALAAENISTAQTTIDGIAINSVAIADENYLFLPASADIQSLSLSFAGNTQPITITGKNGSISAADTFDLAAIASRDADARYTLELTAADGTSSSLHIMQGSAIPTLYLSSDNAAEDREWVDSSKSNEATGTMKLITPDGATIYDGELTQLKARGNSSFNYYPKKAYQIKLDTKSDLLGTGEKVKTWVLLANYGDAAMMRDKLFKDLAAGLGMDYAASCGWVNLYYDGEYRGVYLLSEKNSVGSTSVDITDMEDAYSDLNADYGDDMTTAEGVNRYGQKYTYTQGLTEPENITGGYLIELNHQKFDEVNGFYTAKGKGVNLKGPEYAGQQTMEYISEYYQEFEDAVYARDKAGNYTGYNTETGKYYYEYCDLNSLVQTYLIQQLSLNIDAYTSSFYFYKDVDGLMYAGPVWDMDFTCGNGWSESIHTSRTFIKLRYLGEALSRIPSFTSAVEDYFTQTFGPMSELLLVENGALHNYHTKLVNNAAMNHMLWPYVAIGDPAHKKHLRAEGTTYNTVVDDLHIWLTLRLEKLDESFKPQLVSEQIDTTKNGDEITTQTLQDGSTIEQTKSADGSTTIAVTRPSSAKSTTGVVDTTHYYTTKLSPDGSIDQLHQTTFNVKLNKATVTSAQNIGQTITLPVNDITNTRDEASAPVLTISTSSKTPVSLEIPVADATIGTVAVLLNEDGTETIVQDTTLTADGIKLNVSNGATIRIIDNAADFADIDENAWENDAVDFASSRGILRGVSSDRFGSAETTTRGMFLTVLARAAGQDTTPQNGEHWQQPALDWAVANNISDGSTPDAPITREELATILYRYLGEPTAAGDLTGFTDSDAISDWAVEAMQWAVGAGILRGEGAGILNPTATATRAEIAQVMMNFLTSK